MTRGTEPSHEIWAFAGQSLLAGDVNQPLQNAPSPSIMFRPSVSISPFPTNLIGADEDPGTSLNVHPWLVSGGTPTAGVAASTAGVVPSFTSGDIRRAALTYYFQRVSKANCPSRKVLSFVFPGAPDTIRMCGLHLRRVALYPAELRVHL